MARAITRIAAAILFWSAVPAQAQELRIYHIDVEQADATLVVSPSGNTLLIDAGKNGDSARIKSILDALGINQIDHFVCTHYHADHYGGIDELATDSTLTIVNAYDRGDKDFLPASKLSGDRYIEYDTTIGFRAEPLTRGRTIPLDPEHLSVTCISAGGVVLGEEPPEPASDENDMSISLWIQFHDFQYFIGGDIEKPTERKIAERDLVVDVDVHQSDHHGSHMCSDTAFMRDLNPTAIIISNGSHNGHKHPRQVTLDTYAALDANPTVFQTNEYFGAPPGGNTDPRFIADRSQGDTTGTILVTVPPAADSFTITYADTSIAFAVRDRGGVAADIVIAAVLPNPRGNDREREAVRLRNDSNVDVDVTGWVLRDEQGRIWSLSSVGTIAGGDSVTVVRAGMPMSLTNSGDEISLFDAAMDIRSTLTYDSSQEDVWIHASP